MRVKDMWSHMDKVYKKFPPYFFWWVELVTQHWCVYSPHKQRRSSRTEERSKGKERLSVRGEACYCDEYIRHQKKSYNIHRRWINKMSSLSVPVNSYVRQDSTMSDPNASIEVDFLLPTGILVTFLCSGSQTVADIKERLWYEAAKYPLFSTLRQHGWYVFMFVNRKAEQEECFDETLRLCDLNLYKPLFKVMERKGNEEEKKMSTQISWLIGRQVKEFESSRDPEVTDFRIAMVNECRKAIETRARFDWHEQLIYCYPPVIENGPPITPFISEKLNENKCYRVSVDFSSLGKLGQSTMILVQDLELPNEVIEKALKKIHQIEGEPEISQNPYDYVLKVILTDFYHTCTCICTYK